MHHRSRLGPAVVVAVLCSAPGLWAQVCSSAQFNLIFQGENTGQTSELFAGAIDELVVPTPAGDLGRVSIYVGLVSQVTGSEGVEGWGLQARISGDVLVLGVSSEGTVAAPAPEGLLSNGLFQVRLPNLRDEPGFYNSVVLSFLDRVQLNRVGTATVLRVDLEAAEIQGDAPQTGILEWVNGCGDCPLPLVLGAQLEGRFRQFCSRPGLTVSFVKESGGGHFVRCDANNDGRLNVADSLFIAQSLFLGSMPFPCPDSADCNGDAALNIADALYAANTLFGAVPAPPQPFPDCGKTEDTTAESCPPGATLCD